MSHNSCHKIATVDAQHHYIIFVTTLLPLIQNIITTSLSQHCYYGCTSLHHFCHNITAIDAPHSCHNITAIDVQHCYIILVTAINSQHHHNIAVTTLLPLMHNIHVTTSLSQHHHVQLQVFAKKFKNLFAILLFQKVHRPHI